MHCPVPDITVSRPAGLPGVSPFLGVFLLTIFASLAGAERIDVVAVSSSGGFFWHQTHNDSGMSGDTQTVSDLHGTSSNDMGLSSSGSAPHWVRYDFGKSLPLDEVWIWNYNSSVAPSDGPAHYAKGMKDIVIDYSQDGGDYETIWSGTLPIAQERGEAAGAVDLVVPFEGVEARFVRVTTAAAPDHNYLQWEYGIGSFPDAGLSEVRFYKAKVTISHDLVSVSRVIPVTIASSADVRYDLQRAGSIGSSAWENTGLYAIGTGEDLTFHYSVDDNPAEFIRVAVDGTQAILGLPSEGNGWSTESVVDVRASSSHPSSGVISLINGSGITTNGNEHGINSTTMWLGTAFNSVQRGGTVSGGHWVEFKFNEALPINNILIWNYAQRMGNWNYTGLGVKSVTIQYATTGGGGEGGLWGSDSAGAWTTVFQGDLAAYGPPHPSSGVYTPSDTIDFGGAVAQYVVITASSDSSEVNYASEIPAALKFAGLSEVRFSTGDPFELANSGDYMIEAMGFRFPSVSGDRYLLQRALSGTDAFVETGAFADGTGDVLTLFDPAGYSPTSDYEVVVP